MAVMLLPLSRNSFTASRLNSLLNRRRGCRRAVTGHLILLAAHHCLKEVSKNSGQAHHVDVQVQVQVDVDDNVNVKVS
jgi:hypothetical protein